MVEREEEVQKLSSSLKNLKQERKKLEGNFTSLQETVSDLKQENESLEKVNCWKRCQWWKRLFRWPQSDKT